MAYTLVTAYEAINTILTDLKAGRIGYFVASDGLRGIAASVKRNIPGTLISVPSITELKALHPIAVLEDEYESSEEENYESSYESSEC